MQEKLQREASSSVHQPFPSSTTTSNLTSAPSSKSRMAVMLIAPTASFQSSAPISGASQSMTLSPKPTPSSPPATAKSFSPASSSAPSANPQPSATVALTPPNIPCALSSTHFAPKSPASSASASPASSPATAMTIFSLP